MAVDQWFKETIEKYGFVILDGGLASELEEAQYDLKHPLWSAKVLIEAPEALKEVHTRYLEAGADCITSGSYQATVQGFENLGFTREEGVDFLISSLKLAQSAVQEFWKNPKNRRNRPIPKVAASIGSYGAYLANGAEFTGDYGVSLEVLKNFHRPRLEVFSRYTDLVAFETIPSLLEARAIREVLPEFPNLHAWVSFSAKDEKRISDGRLATMAVLELEDCPQVVAMGINCTSPSFIPLLIREVNISTHKPIIVYPNSGEKYDLENKTWTKEEKKTSFSELARIWYSFGARIIGGCCRTTPSDIQKIAHWRTKLLKSMRESSLKTTI